MSSAPFRVAAGLLIALSACAAPDDASVASSEVQTWALSETPTLQVGAVDGAPEYLMHQVVSSAALPNGNVAVLNAGSHELRIYDASGRWVSQSGRKGGGPGEFLSPLRLYLIGDTLAVFDNGANRYSYHDLDGTFVGTAPIEREPGKFLSDEWLYDRSWVDGPRLGRGRATVAGALSRLPPPDTAEGYRYVVVSDFGHLWVRQAQASGGGPRQWRIHDLSGVQIADATLPAEFEIHEIGSDYLLGRSRDSLGVEYLQRYSLETGGADSAPFAFEAEGPIQPSATDSAAVSDLRGALRMMTVFQELYYANPANGYTYADDHLELEKYQPPEGVEVRIVTGTPSGWRAVAIHRASKTMCGMAIGAIPPVGWMSGVVTC